MAWSDTIKLLTETCTTNDYGGAERTQVESEVCCEVSSISSSEWFEGYRADLNPEYRFVVFFGDYNGQKACTYKGVHYGIYRTYRNGDRVELYAERKSGA